MPESIIGLGQKLKAKYPGAYDDIPDADLGRKLKAKYPGAYDDFEDVVAAPPTAAASVPGAPKPTAKELVQHPSFLSASPDAKRILLEEFSPEFRNMSEEGKTELVSQFSPTTPAAEQPSATPTPAAAPLPAAPRTAGAAKGPFSWNDVPVERRIRDAEMPEPPAPLEGIPGSSIVPGMRGLPLPGMPAPPPLGTVAQDRSNQAFRPQPAPFRVPGTPPMPAPPQAEIRPVDEMAVLPWQQSKDAQNPPTGLVRAAEGQIGSAYANSVKGLARLGQMTGQQLTKVPGVDMALNVDPMAAAAAPPPVAPPAPAIGPALAAAGGTVAEGANLMAQDPAFANVAAVQGADPFKDPKVLADPIWWVSAGGQALGSTLPMMGAGLLAEKAAAPVVGRAAAWATSKGYARLAKLMPGLVGANVSAAVETMTDAPNLYDEVMRDMAARGITGRDAEDTAALVVAKAMLMEGPVTAAFNKAGLFNDKIKARSVRAAVGFLTEGLQEGFQGVTQKAAVKQTYKPQQPLFEDFGSDAAAGAIGGAMSGAMLSAPGSIEDPAAPPPPPPGAPPAPSTPPPTPTQAATAPTTPAPAAPPATAARAQRPQPQQTHPPAPAPVQPPQAAPVQPEAPAPIETPQPAPAPQAAPAPPVASAPTAQTQEQPQAPGAPPERLEFKRNGITQTLDVSETPDGWVADGKFQLGRVMGADFPSERGFPTREEALADASRRIQAAMQERVIDSRGSTITDQHRADAKKVQEWAAGLVQPQQAMQAQQDQQAETPAPAAQEQPAATAAASPAPAPEGQMREDLAQEEQPQAPASVEGEELYERAASIIEGKPLLGPRALGKSLGVEKATADALFARLEQEGRIQRRESQRGAVYYVPVRREPTPTPPLALHEGQPQTAKPERPGRESREAQAGVYLGSGLGAVQGLYESIFRKPTRPSSSTKPSSISKPQLKKIKTITRKMDMPDWRYRELLQAYGSASSKELTEEQATQFLRALDEKDSDGAPLLQLTVPEGFLRTGLQFVTAGSDPSRFLSSPSVVMKRSAAAQKVWQHGDRAEVQRSRLTNLFQKKFAGVIRGLSKEEKKHLTIYRYVKQMLYQDAQPNEEGVLPTDQQRYARARMYLKMTGEDPDLLEMIETDDYLPDKLLEANERLTKEVFKPMHQAAVRAKLIEPERYWDDYLPFYREEWLDQKEAESISDRASALSEELGVPLDLAEHILKHTHSKRVRFGPIDLKRAQFSLPALLTMEDVGDIYIKGWARKMALSEFANRTQPLLGKIGDPALRDYTQAWRDQFLGKRGDGEKRANAWLRRELIRHPRFQKALGKVLRVSGVVTSDRDAEITSGMIASFMTAVQYHAKIGLNAWTALQNLTQVINTVTKAGMVNTAAGIGLAAAAGVTDSRAVRALTAGILPASINPIRRDLIRLKRAGVLDSFSMKYERPIHHGAGEKVAAAMGALFEASEQFNRRTAFFAGYLGAIREGKSEAEAIQAGRDLVRMTQFFSGRLDGVLWSRTPAGRIAFQFKSYTIKQLEFFWHALDRGEKLKFLLWTLAIGGPASLGILQALRKFAPDWWLTEEVQALQESFNLAAWLGAERLYLSLGIWVIPTVENLGGYTWDRQLLKWFAGPTANAILENLNSAYHALGATDEEARERAMKTWRSRFVRGFVPGGIQLLRFERSWERHEVQEDPQGFIRGFLNLEPREAR